MSTWSSRASRCGPWLTSKAARACRRRSGLPRSPRASAMATPHSGVGGGEPGPVVLELTPDPPVRVRVVGEDGRPVAGVPVVLYPPENSEDGLDDEGGPRAITGPDGIAELRARERRGPLRSGAFVALVILAREQVEAPVDLAQLPVEPIELRLPPTGSVAVRLVDPRGEPWKDRSELHVGLSKRTRAEIGEAVGRIDALHATTSDGEELFEHVGLGIELSAWAATMTFEEPRRGRCRTAGRGRARRDRARRRPGPAADHRPRRRRSRPADRAREAQHPGVLRWEPVLRVGGRDGPRGPFSVSGLLRRRIRPAPARNDLPAEAAVQRRALPVLLDVRRDRSRRHRAREDAPGRFGHDPRRERPAGARRHGRPGPRQRAVRGDDGRALARPGPAATRSAASSSASGPRTPAWGSRLTRRVSPVPRSNSSPWARRGSRSCSSARGASPGGSPREAPSPISSCPPQGSR